MFVPRALLLALPIAAALLIPSAPLHAQTEPHEVLVSTDETRERRSRAARLRTSSPTDPDTVWIGHVVGNTGLPGTAGGAGPYHVGRGGNLVGKPGVAENNGYWDWDRFNAGESDSLQGWWPLDRGIGTTGGAIVNDKIRPFHGLDAGNIGNYVMNASGAAQRRTFGVVGYWHRDPGNNTPGLADTGAVIPGPDVEWAPLGGTASAWCGLRGHGDNTVVDDITGSPFNQTIVERLCSMHPAQLGGSVSVLGTDKNFPGYSSQWDQMLYRDVTVADGGTLALSFNYRTNMDTRAFTTTAANRIGWFDKDPLKAPMLNDGNFISSTDAGVNAPVDSFMVYVGVPVDDTNVLYSDGSVAAVYDPLRRWFSEVIRVNGAPYVEVLSTFGVRAPGAFSVTLPNLGSRGIQQLLDLTPSNTLRIVFRVKTNRGFDDGDRTTSAFSSQTAGAAIVDDVVVNGWSPSEGDFEAPGAIDNTANANTAWRSTGKPSGIFFHPVALNTLQNQDPCGPIGGPDRICNMMGRIISPGDADLNDKPGGPFGGTFMDRHGFFGSPTINFKSTGDGLYNDQGIDTDIADATGDYYISLDVYTGGLRGNANGNFYSWAAQAYPARQANGLLTWGEIRTPPFIFFFGQTNCLQRVSNGMKLDNLFLSANSPAPPDSVRIYLQHLTRCFASALTFDNCSPVAPSTHYGTYFDNISFASVDAAPAPGIALNFADLINDAFPVNDAFTTTGGVAFDTCAAQVRTGRNTAQNTGNLNRHNIPGDSVVITAGGVNQRLDMVFRILPGVGNYVQIGSRPSGLRQVPTSATTAVSGDLSWWGQYMADNGAFGTAGNGTSGPGHSGSTATAEGGWDRHRWNSARCDSAERNIFPTVGNSVNLNGLATGVWASLLHESDPKFAALGIVKNRCFLINNQAGAPGTQPNITCGTGSYPPAWTVPDTSGFSDSEGGLAPGQTREFTKIIPDGLLTPGAHVQYFFRKAEVGGPLANFDMAPDTNFIFQPAEGSTDGHRWQQFGILPDRWKDDAFGGDGMACLLFVDGADRRGDERAFISVMDTIGGTSPDKWGAHNGWSARGDFDWTPNGGNPNIGGNDNVSIRAHGGQPGMVFDMFGVKGSESGITVGSLGSRLASQASPGIAAGKFATHGPTPNMLRQFYRILYIAVGDLGASAAPTFGPYANKSDNDFALLNDFSSGSVGTPRPRAVWLSGRHFAESMTAAAYGGAGNTFRNNYFAAGIRSPFYRLFSGNLNNVPDLTPLLLTNPTGAIYGVNSLCTIENDVLTVNGSVTGATTASGYENVGVGGPFVASVYAPPTVAHPHVSLLDAYRIQDIGSRYTLTRGGLMNYMGNTYTSLFSGLSCAIGYVGVPGVGEVPGVRFAPFMDLRSANPLRAGEARIAFGVVATENVEVRVYDVSGRLVKTVARRIFAGGVEHVVTWDGTNDSGRPVARGVYFYQLRSPSFTSQKQLALLR